MKKNEKIIELLEEIRDFLFKKEDKSEDGKIKMGDSFFYINAYGEVCREIFADDLSYDKYTSIGNFFRTEREAEKKVKKLEAIVRVKNYIRDELGYDSEDWCEWRNSKEEKYYMFFDFDINEISSDYEIRTKSNSFIGFLKSKGDCRILIENCKEDLLLILK